MGKNKEKKPRRSKWKEKLDMYDMIIANLLAGNSVIQPSAKLSNKEIAIGFSNIASESSISKYFLVTRFPDYLERQALDSIRNNCISRGVKVNYYVSCIPYEIDWTSHDMKNRMQIYKQYAEETSSSMNVFSYREDREDVIKRERIITSTKYLNEAELVHKRRLMKASFVIEIAAKRDDDSILNMIDTIEKLKASCRLTGIVIRELRVNMLDWMMAISPFRMDNDIKEVNKRMVRKVMSDDIMAHMYTYKQGRVGRTGVPLGIDVLSMSPVLRKFKSDPDMAENWVVAAATGGGKSYWLKALLLYLLDAGFVITVLDYEGEEYSNMAAFVRDGNPEDVAVIAMGGGSTEYFDPMEIGELTGDEDIDSSLKDMSMSYTQSMIRVLVKGLSGELNMWESRVVSTAIQRVYDSAGVTEKRQTWKRSNGLRINDVYTEIVQMVKRKEFVGTDDDNRKHSAAVSIQESLAIYFDEGEVKYGTFGTPRSANDLYKAKFIQFSFGIKGGASSSIDPAILAIKQLSVAFISTQISNHCKYVRKCFNVKVWEEYQRWGDIAGSADIIGNAMTGGRKRGDCNIIVTNDVAELINDFNPINVRLRQNIQNYAIGKIADAHVRKAFCEKFDFQDCLDTLNMIARANMSEAGSGSGVSSNDLLRFAFCLMLDTGKKAIVKAMLPPSVAKSALMKTGVDV